VGSLSDGKVNTNLSAIHLNAIQCVFSLSSVILILIVDEGKAPAAPCVAVQHHLDFLQGPELLELGLELPLVSVETQTEHAKALAGLWLVSVTLMTSPVGHW